jgi:transcriptional regulator with XRE-family HTH domain
MTFGSLVKQKRIDKRIGLRQFCLALSIDPGTWSRVERDLEAPIQNEAKLKNIANFLGLLESEMEDFMYQAKLATGKLPDDVRSNVDLMSVLPAFFRTVNNVKPTQEELRHYVDKLLDYETRKKSL